MMFDFLASKNKRKEPVCKLKSRLKVIFKRWSILLSDIKFLTMVQSKGYQLIFWISFQPRIAPSSIKILLAIFISAFVFAFTASTSP